MVDSCFQRHRSKVSPFSCSIAAGHRSPVVPALLVWGWTLGVTAVLVQLSKVCPGSGFVGCPQDQEALPEDRWYFKPPVLIQRFLGAAGKGVSPIGQSRRDVSPLAVGPTSRIHLRVSLPMLGCALWCLVVLLGCEGQRATGWHRPWLPLGSVQS